MKVIDLELGDKYNDIEIDKMGNYSYFSKITKIEIDLNYKIDNKKIITSIKENNILPDYIELTYKIMNNKTLAIDYNEYDSDIEDLPLYLSKVLNFSNIVRINDGSGNYSIIFFKNNKIIPLEYKYIHDDEYKIFITFKDDIDKKLLNIREEVFIGRTIENEKIYELKDLKTISFIGNGDWRNQSVIKSKDKIIDEYIKKQFLIKIDKKLLDFSPNKYRYSDINNAYRYIIEYFNNFKHRLKIYEFKTPKELYFYCSAIESEDNNDKIVLVDVFIIDKENKNISMHKFYKPNYSIENNSLLNW